MTASELAAGSTKRDRTLTVDADVNGAGVPCNRATQTLQTRERRDAADARVSLWPWRPGGSGRARRAVGPICSIRAGCTVLTGRPLRTSGAGIAFRPLRPGGAGLALLVPTDLRLQRAAMAHQIAARQRRVDQPDRPDVLEYTGRIDLVGVRDRRERHPTSGREPGNNQNRKPPATATEKRLHLSLLPRRNVCRSWRPLHPRTVASMNDRLGMLGRRGEAHRVGATPSTVEFSPATCEPYAGHRDGQRDAADVLRKLLRKVRPSCCRVSLSGEDEPAASDRPPRRKIADLTRLKLAAQQLTSLSAM